MSDNSNTLVLVTGGTGYISSHAVQAFLNHGYRVRTTCRDPTNKEKAAALYRLQEGLDDPSRLEIVQCKDLLEPTCWVEAAKGCQLCAHLASPFYIAKSKKDEAVMCEAAVNGTLNVLKACEAADIKRVVVTSSMAAVSYGHELHGQTIEKPEEMWSVEDKVNGYILSKLLAERAAWKFIKEDCKNGMQMSTINPTWVVGPPLGANWATSHEVLTNFFQNKLPAIPDLNMNSVHVLDVAEAHVLALEKPEAVGKRFCAVGPGFSSMRQIAADLQEALGPFGYKFKQGKLPKWILSMASLFNKTYKSILPNVGTKPPVIVTSQSETILGLKYRETARSAHVAQARALLDLGANFLKVTPQYQAHLDAQTGSTDGAEKATDAAAEDTTSAAAADTTSAAETAKPAPATE